MSNLIPPLLSSSPPPIVGPLDEDEEDEFGDFRAAADSYDCDDLSLPPSPQKSPEKELKPDFSKVNLDINSNKSQITSEIKEMPNQKANEIFNEVEKDFQDRRKSDDFQLFEIGVNLNNSQSDGVNDETVASESINDQILDKTDIDCSEQIDLENFDPVFEPVESQPTESENDVKTNSVKDTIVSSNEENVFDAFSESPQYKTDSNVSELNDSNEIKSDCPDTTNYESEDDDKEDKLDSSSKEVNYDNLSESSISIKICETDPKLSDDEFGDFANFDEVNNDSDEFDDFVNPPPDGAPEESDDFGDFESSEFTDFASQTCDSFPLEVNEKNAAEKSESILKEIFPVVPEDGDADFVNETRVNAIFEELKDVTETNALIYQWSKSNSQKMFFKALNIDTRNILYGPAWNGSMPRFAANLGLTPLEPVKSDILTPIPAQNAPSPSISSQSNGDIPTAQFDWSGSGLINPLDYLEQLVASLDIPTTNSHPNQSPSPSNDLLDEWDLWLQSTSTEPPASVSEPVSTTPTSSDFLPPPAPIPILFDKPPSSDKEVSKLQPSQLDEFSSFQSPKLVPLRETHISNELTEKPLWLQPTIVTPDLPRKEPILDPEDDDDEFDDFQMVLPQENVKTEKIDVEKKVLPVTEFDFKQPPEIKKPINHEHIKSGPIEPPKLEDDEFTEFHSSAPPQPQILKPLPLEPLKPTVQYSSPVAQINWPNPGVSDDDIRNIELVYSRKKTEKDDEEWTDFVSSKDRTATPDLPLSVLNLNNVQAPKQPIPVITPMGLVQTKLSSNPSSSVVQTTVQPSMYRPPTAQVQPSLISSQFLSASQTSNDDDDWSDFVSGQPPVPQINGYQQRNNWTASAATNIIMNPTHFQNYVPPQKKVPVMPARGLATIPDLDFIAPKNRTTKK